MATIRETLILGMLKMSARRARAVSTDTKELYVFMSSLYPHRAALVERNAEEWVDPNGRTWEIFDRREAIKWN